MPVFLSAVGEAVSTSVPDIPRIYTAIAEWAACMILVFVLKKRFVKARFWLLVVLSLGVMIGVQLIAGELPLYLWIPGMVTAMLAMYGIVFTLCKVKPSAAVFWTARAFILAEFAAALQWQLSYYIMHTLSVDGNIFLETVLLVVTYSAVFASAYFLERRYSKSNLHMSISKGVLLSVSSVALIIFAISNISFISRNTPLSGQYASDIFYIRTLVDLCGLILLYGLQEQRLWARAKIELDAMQNIISRQYEQYCMSKDNIEHLNRRYHDIKHQIALIKAENSPKKKTEYIDAMETGIRALETQSKTGNPVLDVILTSKSHYCLEQGINFTCVADGEQLGFLDVMDLCSIVGNALDNAFESVAKLKDNDKKIVKLAAYAQNELLIMRVENYIDSRPVFEDGLPVTTKPKRENHGYGIKSIKSLTEKYGGSMRLSAEDNWFVVCLLIPIEKNRR